MCLALAEDSQSQTNDYLFCFGSTMTRYSLLIFDGGLSAQKIFSKFSEQELGHLVFSSQGMGGVHGAIQYLSNVQESEEIDAFLVSSIRKQSDQAECEQRMLAEALRDTANTLNQSLDLREVLDSILNKVGLVVPNDAANIMLIEDDAAIMTACRGYEKLGGEERVMKQTRVWSAVPNLRRVAESGRPLVVPDTSNSPDWIEFETSSWIHSYASAPISHKGRMIGFLNLNSATPGFYDQHSAERLLAFADQAAIAIENARLYEKAQQEIVERRRAEKALQEAKNVLEERVVQRTAELSSANEQLMLELARREQAEKALEEERALLASRVEERTAELRSANAELAKAVRLKDTFLANMSHELRTPLNAVLNISETLREQVYGEMNEQQIRSVRTIEDSGRHLLTLINDILDLSKIGAGKLDLNMDFVPVRELCLSSLQYIDEAARKKQLDVSTSFDPSVLRVCADQRRLKQILLNLLSNAVKFTPAGGSIGLLVVGDRDRNCAEFTVWDTGIGIPQESMDGLFKPFVQLDSSLSRQYEGTGLGLALVYHLVELHGGGIRVESEVGKGSRFIITLNWSGENGPLEDVPSKASNLARVQPSPLDEQNARAHLLSRYLEEMGIKADNVWVQKGRIPKLEQVAPDFIVVDPRLAADGFLHFLREEPAWQDLPIIVLGDPQNVPGLLPLPPSTGFLKPPFTRQSLRTLMKQMSPRGTASFFHKVLLLHERAAGQDKERTTILLVDDNEYGIRATTDYLSAKGYRVVRAYNGAEALEWLRENRPDLILMDIQMPGMDGLDAIRNIRADTRSRKIPIIAFTALAMPGDRDRCLQAGADAYLSKPFSLKGLTAAIEAHIAGQAFHIMAGFED